MNALSSTALQFGSIFYKKKVVVQKDTHQPDENYVSLLNRLDGSVYTMPKAEFEKNYQPTKAENFYQSRDADWRDIQIVDPGDSYISVPKKLTAQDIASGKITRPVKAKYGILARQEGMRNAFYEISPSYFISAYDLPDPTDPGYLESLKDYAKIRSLAKIVGPAPTKFPVNPFAKVQFFNTKYTMALSGYSDISREYGKTALDVLYSIVNKLGRNHVGFVTSPTATPNSIDAAATIVAQRKKLDLLYLTAEEFLEYMNPDKFPKEINRDVFEENRKISFNTAAEYSRATARTSNICVVIGGRNQAVHDAANALRLNNKLVIINDEALQTKAIDETRNRVDNASRYLIDRLNEFKAGQSITHTIRGGVTTRLFTRAKEKGRGAIDNQIKVITINSSLPESIEDQIKEQDKTAPSLQTFLDM